MAAKERTSQDLLHRWEGNPIITVEDMPFPCNTVFNGTPMVTDEGILLLLRVEGLHGYSFFALGRSDEGLHFTIDEVVFAEPGDMTLLGARTLEGLNLIVNSAQKKLVAAGPLPAARFGSG